MTRTLPLQIQLERVTDADAAAELRLMPGDPVWFSVQADEVALRPRPRRSDPVARRGNPTHRYAPRTCVTSVTR